MAKRSGWCIDRIKAHRSRQKRLQLLVSPAGFTEPKETLYNGTRLSERRLGPLFIKEPFFLSADSFLALSFQAQPTLSPPGKLYSVEKRLVTTSKGRTYEGTTCVSALRVERKRRWRSRPWRNLVALIAILYLCGRSSRAKFSLSRPTSTKLPSCLSIVCRDPA